MNLNQELAYIHQLIPITAHLQTTISKFDGNEVVINAPLKPNKNLHGTAFGGSQAAVGILSGWALIYLKLKELGIKNDLVIQKSSYDFLKPVTAEFFASCQLPSEEKFQQFVKTLKEKGKARLLILSDITSEAGLCGRHEGLYVIFLK
jgi:thioesterase domain-containing protein